MEITFLISMIVKFLTDYIPEGENKPTKDFVLIAKNYLNNGFIWDFIPLLPLNFILNTIDDRNYELVRIALFIKLIRIINGLKLFNIRFLFGVIKDKQKKRVTRIIN